MGDKPLPTHQGWYCVIENHCKAETKSGRHLPWLDVQFPKAIDPEKLIGKDLELVTREVCAEFERRYTKKVSLSWEKRDGDRLHYETTFDQKENKICRTYP